MDVKELPDLAKATWAKITSRAPGASTGPEITASGFTPAPPRVDLTPDSVRTKIAEARQVRTVAVASTLAVLSVGGLYVNGVLTGSDLDSQISEAEQVNSDLIAEAAVFAPVTSMGIQTANLTATIDAQTNGVISHARALERFLAAGSKHVDFTSVQINTDGPGGCTTTDPFNEAILVGCIIFTGNVSSSDSAADLVSALTADEWFIDPFIPNIGTSTTAEGAPVAGTVGLTETAATVVNDEQAAQEATTSADQPADPALPAPNTPSAEETN